MVNGEKRALPFPCEVLKESEEITNPFSGVKVTLPPDAVAVYDCIKGAELIGNNDHLRKGLDWFITNEPEAYMKLLDQMPTAPYQDDIQYNESREEAARESYYNGWYAKTFQKKYKTWQEFMKSQDFTDECDRLMSKFRQEE